MIESELQNFSDKYLNRYKIDGPVLITGATGLIGSSLIKALEYTHPNIEIYALCRNEIKLREKVSKTAIFVEYDILTPINLSVKNAVVIHCASPTSSEDFYNRAPLIMKQITESTKNIADFCVKNSARNLLLMSTLEIYGETNNISSFEENLYYGIDPLTVRNSYALSKLMAENIVSYYSEKFNLKTTIMRLSQVLGQPLSADDNRVVFYFSKQVLSNNDIILKTSGSTIRNYLYYLDLIEAIYILLSIDKTNNIDVFNVSYPDSGISITDLAYKFIEIYNSNSQVLFELENSTIYRDNLNLVLNVNKMLETGWKPKYNIDKSVLSLINLYKNLIEIGEAL